MVKKEYVRPEMKVVHFQQQFHMLVGSIRSVNTTGLDANESIGYGDNGENKETDMWGNAY
ncbi:MAG: hypothetical protein IJS97_08305 [Prevotella sp.]|nr:hypothetical protein [Prevotella sp.]